MARVLVVDDSLSVRKVVEKALSGRGMQVLTAASGSEAIERIERDHPDVVICDVVLPDKEGYQVCEFVRAHPVLAKTPVLLISGVNNSVVRSRAAEVRSNGVMFKPFAADDLVRKIDGLMMARGDRPAAGSTPAATPAAVNGLHGVLADVVATPGVRLAALVDREGFLVDVAGPATLDPAVAAALASCVLESAQGIGRDLAEGALLGIMLEYEHGMVLLQDIGPRAFLAVAIGDPSALGKTRYCMRKARPELQRLL